MRAMRRVPRAAVTQARLYRLAVPLLLVALGLVTAALLLLAGGVLLGLVPYPGR